jgi:hypothetical protein
MYHFVYWYFYDYFRKRGNRSSSTATFMVGLTLIIHLVLLYTVINAITGWKVPYFPRSYEYGERKYILMLLLLPIFFLLDYIYFKRRRLHILAVYKEQNISSKKNIVKVLLITVLPLVLSFLPIWSK